MTPVMIREIREWLDEHGVEGLLWEEIDPEADCGPEPHPGAIGAVRLRSTLPCEDPFPLLSLVGRILRHFVWIETARIVAVPVAPTRRYVVAIDLVLYDPQQCFESPQVLSALEGPGTTLEKSEAVSTALTETMSTYADSLSPEDRDTFSQGLAAYCFTGISTDRDQQVAAFKALVPAELHPVIRDWRLNDLLDEEHHRILEGMEEWMFRDRTSMEGRLKGVTIRPCPWVNLDSWQLASEISEVGGEITRTRPDPEALLAIIADEDALDRHKFDALMALKTLPEDEAAPCLVRSAGYPGRRSDALLALLHIPRAIPLLRELILTREPGRILPALDRLRDYGTEFGDPMAAWDRAAGDPPREERRGAGLQVTTLLGYTASGDRSVIPLVLREIEARSRSEEWVRGALVMLMSFGAVEAVDTALALAKSPSPLLRAVALQFFCAVDHPPAVPVLLEALRDDDLWVVSAAETGLTGQESLETAAILDALAVLEKRAEQIPCASEDESYRRRLGGTLAETLQAREIGDEPPPVLEAVLRRTRDPWTQSLEEGGTVSPKGEEPDPLDVFEERLQLWESVGYVTEQYRSRGHRDPRWDSKVEEAHDLYDPDAKERHAAGIRLYEEALRAGCQDGLVHYRLGILAAIQGDKASCLRHFVKVCDLLPQQYPDSPYHLKVAEVVAEHHAMEGRWEDACEVLRDALTGEMETETSRARLDRLETLAGLPPEDEAEQPILRMRGLAPLSARYLRGDVTSLQISPDGEILLSADSEGWVQVHWIESERRLYAGTSLRITSSGSTRAALVVIDEDILFVAGGWDGRIVLCRPAEDPDAPFETTLLVDHDSGITALVGARDGQFVFADEQGKLAACDLESGVVTPIPRRGKGAIRSLEVRHSHLAALAGASEVEVWSLEPDTEPVLHKDLTRYGRVAFIDIGSPDSLLIKPEAHGAGILSLEPGAGDELAFMGEDSERYSLARMSQPHGILIWAGSDGRIWTESERSEYAPVIALDAPAKALAVDFENRTIACADSSRQIGVYPIEADLYPPEEETSEEAD